MATGKTITQRIALEGGADIRSQLEAIGKAGQEAFKKIQDAAGANALLSRFSAQVEAVRSRVQEVAVAAQRFGQDFRNLGDRAATTARNLALVGTVVVGITAAFARLVLGAGEAADKLRETAEQVGITSQELSNLQFAFQQSGVNSEALGKALIKLNTGMEAARDQAVSLANRESDLRQRFVAGKTSVTDYFDELNRLRRDAPESAFQKLGVRIRDSNGELRNSREVLLDIADAFKKLPDGAQKSALAVQLFGKGNAKLVNGLNQGRAGITALEKEAERVAPALTKLQETVADELGDAFDTMKKSATSAKNSILLLFAPAITSLVQAFTEAIVRNREAAFNFAAALADRVRPVVQDLIALLEGREVDKNSFILRARDGIVEFGTAVNQVVFGVIVPAFKGLMAILNTVAQAINGVFGTQISGQTILITALILKLVGAFALLLAAVKVVVAAVAVLAAVVGGVNLALLAVVAAIAFFTIRAVGGLAGIQAAWTATWTAIANFVLGVLNRMQSGAATIASAIGSFIVGAFQGIATAVSGVGTAILEAFAAVIQNIVTAFVNLPTLVAVAFQALVTLAAATWAAIVAAAQNVGTGLLSIFTSAINSVKGVFTDLGEWALGIFTKIIDGARAVGAALKSALGGASGAGLAKGGAVGFAQGGRVHGAGTGTSDSIWAKLSNGEFVQRFAAVRKYGVDFMHAINRGLISADAVRSLMGGGLRFNFGGLVDGMNDAFAIPRFAGGGLAMAGGGGGGMQSANIMFPGGHSFAGQFKPDVVQQMQRYAVSKNVRSTGRKPSWYQG